MTTRLAPRLIAAIGTAALTFALLTGAPASADTGSTTSDAGGTSVWWQLKQVKLATARYNDIDVALADGYHPPHPYVCVEGPDGTMGYHYLRPDRLDDTLDIRKPELLLYIQEDDGSMDLVAVEYMKPDADQDLSTDDDRPTLFDQPFQGPMAGHEEGMPVHYDLHVWLWEDNPAGMFAQWNPAISC